MTPTNKLTLESGIEQVSPLTVPYAALLHFLHTDSNVLIGTPHDEMEQAKGYNPYTATLDRIRYAVDVEPYDARMQLWVSWIRNFSSRQIFQNIFAPLNRIPESCKRHLKQITR